MNPSSRDKIQTITSIGIEGYKSIVAPQAFPVAPITIIAGANSSGKSSMMQPLLLLKQTLAADYDPGPLLLHGPNVKLSQAAQTIPLGKKRTSNQLFSIAIVVSEPTFSQLGVRIAFKQDQASQIAVESTLYEFPNKVVLELREDSTPTDLKNMANQIRTLFGRTGKSAEPLKHAPKHLTVKRSNFFYELAQGKSNYSSGKLAEQMEDEYFELDFFIRYVKRVTASVIQEVIHIPGLRGNPERSYIKASTGPTFPGVFSSYVASIISSWIATTDERHLILQRWLSELGLTCSVQTHPVEDIGFSVFVNRFPSSGSTRARTSSAAVNIADVGVGVSQVLPMLVALLIAKSGQLVYIEQPEIHLHPHAQVALGKIFSEAASRGVKIIAETHSSTLLLSLQNQVASGRIKAEDVVLLWFQRSRVTGYTNIKIGELDKLGAYGAWPEDFSKTALDLEIAFLQGGLTHD